MLTLQRYSGKGGIDSQWSNMGRHANGWHEYWKDDMDLSSNISHSTTKTLELAG